MLGTGLPPTFTARLLPSSIPKLAAWCTRFSLTPDTPTSWSRRCGPRSVRMPRAGRLALWGRRLVGEALTQAQRVAASRDALSSLLTGTVDRPGLDLAAISRMFTRLIENHARRMSTLGLQS